MSGRVWRLVFGVVVIAGALCAAGADGTEDGARGDAAARRYLAAYDSMEMGDWLVRQDMEEAAADLYREALARFRRIAVEYPLWQKDLVEFRIDYCVNQLEKIEIAAQPAAGRPGRAEAVDEKIAEPVAGDKPHHEAFLEALRLERLPDLRGAAEAYAAILEEQPSHLQALKGAVRCQLRMGSIDDARSLIGAGAAGTVTDSGLLHLMALVECHDRQFDAAIRLLRLAMEGDRMNAGAHVAMGVALAGQGRLGAARDEMKRAISINPRISEAYYNLAWISLRQDPRNTGEVRVHYNNALRYGGEPDPLLERLFK